MWVLLRCPGCHVRQNFNGRGACHCGAYLLHSFHGRRVMVPRRAVRWIPDLDGAFECVYDDGTEEPGRWEPIEPGLYQLPDGRTRRIAKKPEAPLWNWRPGRNDTEDDP